MSYEQNNYLKFITDAIEALEQSLEILNADIEPELQKIKALEADKEAYKAVMHKFGKLYAAEQGPLEEDAGPDDYESVTHGY